MNLTNLVIQLIGGAAGAQGITGLIPSLSSGPTLDIVIGIVGGYVGGQLVGLIPGLQGTDIVGVIGNLVGGGVGGGAFTAIVGMVRHANKE